MPDAGHQIWAQLPKASHPNGGPSGGAHRGVFTSPGEHRGWADAVVGANPMTARFKVAEMAVAAANPRTTGRCMAVPFRSLPRMLPADPSSHMGLLPNIRRALD